MPLTLPDPSLVLLIGPSGSGKTTFARRHFASAEVVSSDACRALVANDESDQASTGDAFDLLRFIADKRLRRGLLTVIDATNLLPEYRQPLIELARQFRVPPVAIIFDLPERISIERNFSRPERNSDHPVVNHQLIQLRRGLRGLGEEGFHQVTVFKSVADVDATVISRAPRATAAPHAPPSRLRPR